MGRLLIEFVDDSKPKFVCSCNCDIASEQHLIWQGYMGAQEPALLFRSCVNLAQCSGRREEQLSTGRYTLCDVACRGCGCVLGWQYLAAERPDQAYKEGTLLLQQAALQRINDPESWDGKPLPLWS